VRALNYLPDELQAAFERDTVRTNAEKPVRIMKFGGTSVADASSIIKVAEIVRVASQDGAIVVVVSAMSGVTDKLVGLTTHLEAGNTNQVAITFKELRAQHSRVLNGLVHSAPQLTLIRRRLREIFREGTSLCESAILRRKLALCERDRVLGLGERLSAPLVAAALEECGVASEAIEATELIVTDSHHGHAEPQIDTTRELCEARLLPLLQQGVVPVITGYIGATAEGVPTTLGRGSSDYSATILGAALNADRVTIWTDVDGVLTTDPRLVPDAHTILELSYSEAAELAHFGAKVLHAKTLRPVMQSGIPIWIRNTFAPERAGTRITPAQPPDLAGVKALTALAEVALITVGTMTSGTEDTRRRTPPPIPAIRPEFLVFSQSSERGIYFVVPSEFAQQVLEMLCQHVAEDSTQQGIECVSFDPSVAVVTVVGTGLNTNSGIVSRMLGALKRANINAIATAQGSSGSSFSVLVDRTVLKTALIAVHREFQLDVPKERLDLPSTNEGSANSVDRISLAMAVSERCECECSHRAADRNVTNEYPSQSQR
jgi:bifunctional aspartokinase / homoserine dehydrogenase 1